MTDPALLPERLLHDRIERAAEQIVDAMGAAGAPYLVESMLARLERHGAINRGQRLAGERFGELFRIASLDPMKAADIGQRFTAAPWGVHPSEWARGRINAALDACGGLHSPCGCCAWFVLGLELSVRDFAIREGWSGRPLRPEVAKGLLVGCLGILQRHFGL